MDAVSGRRRRFTWINGIALATPTVIPPLIIGIYTRKNLGRAFTLGAIKS